MAYTTLSDVKDYLGVVTSEDDTLLTGLVAVAQQVVESWCGRVFEADADSTRLLDCRKPTVEGRTLFLADDLCAITSITNGDGTSIEAGDYVTVPETETPYREIVLLASSGQGWTYTDDPEQALSIEGRWAYSTTAPVSVVHATKEVAGWLYRSYDRQGVVGDGAQMVGDGPLPGVVVALLEPYRRVG